MIKKLNEQRYKTTSQITLEQLEEVCLSNERVRIYDTIQEEMVCDGDYLRDFLKKNPDWRSAEITHLTSSGSKSLWVEVVYCGDY